MEYCEQRLFIEREKLFRANPIDLELKTHKFDRQLDDIFTFSVTSHYRVAFVSGEEGDVTFITVLVS